MVFIRLSALFLVGTTACTSVDSESRTDTPDAEGAALLPDASDDALSDADTHRDAVTDSAGQWDAAADGMSVLDDGSSGDPVPDTSDPSAADTLEDGTLADSHDDTRPPDVLEDADSPDTAAADVIPDVDDDGLPFGPLPSLTEVLAFLEADPAAGVRQLANARGWPLSIAGGSLFVCLDTSLTHIAGEFDGWAGTPMNVAAGFRWVTLRDLPAGQRYKFTDRVRYVADPFSRALVWDDFGEMSLTVPDFAHIERYFGITDGLVSARNLFVWVPAEPVSHVLYAHDGQNVFGPGSAFGSWRMEEAAPDGMLIVGIFNTADRFNDYTPVTDRVGGIEVGGRAAAYLGFVRDTVRPLIRRVYGEPGPVGILGSSLGGVVSLYALVLQPSEWDFAASLSGALSWGSRLSRNETLHSRTVELSESGAVIYLDSGGRGATCEDADGDGVNDDDPDERDDFCVTAQLRDGLASAGMVFSDNLWHWWEADALHNEAAWAVRVSRPLAIFGQMVR
jgi:predicted alpha/beta superfamily hydrolase